MGMRPQFTRSSSWSVKQYDDNNVFAYLLVDSVVIHPVEKAPTLLAKYRAPDRWH